MLVKILNAVVSLALVGVHRLRVWGLGFRVGVHRLGFRV